MVNIIGGGVMIIMTRKAHLIHKWRQLKTGSDVQRGYLMKTIEEMRRIPASRMKREMTSIIRRKEVVLVTYKDLETVFAPAGTEEFDVVHEAHKDDE